MAQLIWDKVLKSLELRINKQSFAMWLRDTEPLSIVGDVLTIKVKDEEIKKLWRKFVMGLR